MPSPIKALLLPSSSLHNFGLAYNDSLQVAIAIIPLIPFRHGPLHPLHSSSGSRNSVSYFTCRIVSDTETRSYLPGAHYSCDNRSPECRKVLLVSVTLPMLIKTRSFIHPTIDLGSLFGLLSSVITLIFSVPVRGTYNIAGRYCEPEVDIPSRRNSLQLLAHPATYDRNYVGSPPGSTHTHFVALHQLPGHLLTFQVVWRRLPRIRIRW